ncbi:hypothetical protein FNO01nite_06750 [Flavobacterium noncentrifugens]|uniref:Uncharacterized protein n=1 Tax=Flavobacterium noncentrifugens TaxID=1128970 RepID=A0A1G8SXA6_9FLAO|nr:hypothetical protein [Flavobacterium noncentrifugens]GEP50003.1 hypothetical protein FNO01nite_06750 [Flavobacterium noncentrifugens]SDJ33867.1 hypothetical protein SAMN04487935_0735 [Flavobacterium noncentrifugens]
MRKLLLLIGLISINASAQNAIEMKNGTKINPVENSIHVDANGKKIYYKLPNVVKEQKLKFTDLNIANFGDYRFKSFTINKKSKSYYVLAEDKGKTLATIKISKVISRGGFESVLDFYELVVLDADSNLLASTSFSANNSDKSIQERAGVNPLIQTHFPDCPKLLEKAKLFESNSSDTNNRMIMTFLDIPVFINCR